MSHDRRYQDSIMAAGAGLLTASFGSSPTAPAISGDLDRGNSPSSNVELALTKLQQRLGRPKDPPGTCTMSQQPITWAWAMACPS